MSRIVPFEALLPRADKVDRIICPPYDVIDSEEARALASGNPWSLLHVTKPEVDLPPGTPLYDEAVYATGAENLTRFCREETLVRDRASFYLYRLTMGGRAQTGVVAGAAVEEYENGRIKQHERTREEKVVDRTRHSIALRAHAEPVFLVHRRSQAIALLAAKETRAAPLFDVTTPDGVRHEFWRVEDAGAVMHAFLQLDALYIADGHHRSAASLRTRNALREKSEASERANFFPAVIFPEEEVRVFQYDWSGDPHERPLAAVTIADIMTLSDEGGIMSPKSTWFAPKLASGFFVYPF